MFWLGTICSIFLGGWGVLLFGSVDFLLQNGKRLFQFTSKQRFPFLECGGFKIVIQLNFTFQKLSEKGLHAKVVCHSLESMAELRREIYFSHDATTWYWVFMTWNRNGLIQPFKNDSLNTLTRWRVQVLQFDQLVPKLDGFMSVHLALTDELLE